MHISIERAYCAHGSISLTLGLAHSRFPSPWNKTMATFPREILSHGIIAAYITDTINDYINCNRQSMYIYVIKNKL